MGFALVQKKKKKKKKKLPFKDDYPTSWQIQMTNCQCQLSTMHLVADSLYVAVRQFVQLRSPKSYTGLDCGMETLRALLTVEFHMRKTVDKPPALYNRSEQMGRHFGIESTQNGNFIPWTRPTFYTPPRLVKPRIPDRLFKRTPFDLNSRLQKLRRIDQLESAFPSIDTSKHSLQINMVGYLFLISTSIIMSKRKSKKTNILLTLESVACLQQYHHHPRHQCCHHSHRHHHRHRLTNNNNKDGYSIHVY